MKSLSIDSMNVVELSRDEERAITGGDTMVKYHDSEGYTWYYTYSDSGELVGVAVARAMCQ
jgi:hypothetical protein